MSMGFYRPNGKIGRHGKIICFKPDKTIEGTALHCISKIYSMNVAVNIESFAQAIKEKLTHVMFQIQNKYKLIPIDKASELVDHGIRPHDDADYVLVSWDAIEGNFIEYGSTSDEEPINSNASIYEVDIVRNDAPDTLLGEYLDANLQNSKMQTLLNAMYQAKVMRLTIDLTKQKFIMDRTTEDIPY
jgi:hypothetical protein